MSSSLVSHRSGASAAAASRKPTVHVCAQLGGQPRPTKAQPARAATVVASSATMAFPMEQQGLAGWWQGVVTSLAPEREQEQDWSEIPAQYRDDKHHQSHEWFHSHIAERLATQERK